MDWKGDSGNWAFRVGWFTAQLRQHGYDAEPVMDGGDFTNKITMTAIDPLGNKRILVLAVEQPEEDDVDHT